MTPALRDAVVAFAHYLSERAPLILKQLLTWLDIPSSTCYHWGDGRSQPNRRNATLQRATWLRAWERQAILDYQQEHPEDGYRRLTYMMRDAEVVAVSPRGVRQVLKVDWDVLRMWCEDKRIDYAIIDTEMMTSLLTLLEKHFEIEEGQLAMKDTPPGWILTYAHPDIPAGFFIFEVMGRSSLNHSLAYEFEDHFTLLGYRLDRVEVRPGQEVHLTLY